MKCVEKFLQSVENLNKILTERISMFARLYVGILMKPEYIWENDMLTEIPKIQWILMILMNFESILNKFKNHSVHIWTFHQFYIYDSIFNRIGIMCAFYISEVICESIWERIHQNHWELTENLAGKLMAPDLLYAGSNKKLNSEEIWIKSFFDLFQAERIYLELKAILNLSV